jgi:broad specificity phosphatase PhoE
LDVDAPQRKSNFGLINRSYDTDAASAEKEQWKRLERYVRHVQSQARDGESFKVLFLGRHGQGWHNVAEAKYGTKAWDVRWPLPLLLTVNPIILLIELTHLQCYYSALDGFDNITWADATLTSTGQDQAKDVATVWKQQIPLGIPLPESYYVSPLTRTIETADLSFSTLDLPQDKPYKPLIKELLREALGVHTCDRRSTRNHISSTFSHVAFEPGFSDADLLWEADYREPDSARRYRLNQFLDDVFASDENVFLSMTSHSGAIASILEAIGHRKFALKTGGVVPVFVKAVRVEGERGVPEKEPSAAPPLCDGPPEV